MKENQKSQLLDLEIAQLLKESGLNDSLQGLMAFDSAHYPTDTIWSRPFRSSHYSIIVIHQGTMSVKVNVTEHLPGPNDVLIIPPNAIREIRWEKENVHFSSLLFKPGLLSSAPNLARAFSGVSLYKSGVSNKLTISPEDHEILSQTFILIRLLLTKKDVFEKQQQEIVQLIFQSAILQISRLQELQETETPKSISIVHRFFDLLERHYKQEREVSFYAAKLNLHEKYLSQVLKSQTGKTARMFIIQIVILEAKVLLDYNDLTVGEIASQLHFTNQYHFSHFFKQYASMSPTDYRNGRS